MVMGGSRHTLRCTLGSDERLKLRKQIETLFSKGEAFSVFPLRIIYLMTDKKENDYSPARIGFSVPKKKIKTAVGRNLIKRRLREAWRLNKHALYATIPEGKQLHCFVIYLQTEYLTYASIQKLLLQSIGKLQATIVTD